MKNIYNQILNKKEKEDLDHFFKMLIALRQQILLRNKYNYGEGSSMKER